jgi:hypothetical protein
MLGLHPNAVFTPHVGQSGGRGVSPRLWSRVDGQELSPDGASNGYSIGDEFLSFGATFDVASNVGRYASEAGGYKSYEDTGAAISQVASVVGGAVAISIDADDNQEAWLQSGGGTGVLGKISDTAGEDKLLIFEARFKTSQITAGNLFLGLAEEGLAAHETMTDDGDLASKDLIGFAVNEDAPSTLTFVYRKAGQALQTPIASLKTLVADTFYKVGFVYDPRAVPSQRIRVYVDNVENGTYVTATNIAAATFPDGEELAFLAGVKNATDIMTLTLDWWNFYQAG